MKTILNGLITVTSKLAHTRSDQELIAAALKALDDRYALSQKIMREPGIKDILQQQVGRIFRAYGILAAVESQRILDIACGSNTSKAPPSQFVNTPFGKQQLSIPPTQGYSSLFESWFCRLLLELQADPVGVDLGNLDREIFEHYPVDLGQPGALDFLPDCSFDAVQDSRLFGSPEFTTRFPNQEQRLNIAREIWHQEQRLLKPSGIVIHSDAARLLGKSSSRRGIK